MMTEQMMQTMQTKLSRRHFLRAGTLAGAAGLLGWLRPGRSLAETVLDEGGEAAEAAVVVVDGWTLPELPYSYSSLDPYIDARTMELHHSRHHAGYASKAAAAIAGQPELAGLSVEEVMARLETLPEPLQTTLRNNGGGHYNHSLFWSLMSPRAGRGAPIGQLGEAIQQTFGGFVGLREQFGRAAASRFGSGWAWLIVDDEGQLVITSTPNQDNPLMTGLVEQTGTPVLGLDVWEHAYYLLYQNRRSDYTSAWWSVVDWRRAEELYLAALAKLD
jgi:superoxide dismutase, Fe-Mn family